MKLHTYVAREVKNTGQNKTNILKGISKASGVSLLTLQSVERGSTLELFSKAKAVSEATDGQVTVLELLDPDAKEVRKRQVKK